MTWSNQAPRDRLVVEKSHSLSLAVRVEDRLHRDIITSGDECWFTVRNDEFLVGHDDTTAEISVSGTIITTSRGQVFRIDIQATDLNLDPELDWFYTISFSREDYSIVLLAGEFDITANVTNRGAAGTFVGGNGVYNYVASIDGRNLLNVTTSMPLPLKGDTGFGTHLTSAPLSEIVGTVETIAASTIDGYGRIVQTGDMLFSTATKGVLGQITGRTFEAGGLVSVEVTVKQVYGLETLKALLDTVSRDTIVTTIGHNWTLNKADAPLPPSYQYHAGDLVFSSSTDGGLALDKYLVVSIVTAVNALTLDVQSKIVFPMFTEGAVLQDLFDQKVPITRTINGHALNTDITVSGDDISDGAARMMMTAAERTKLASVATGATANASNDSLLDRSNHTGTQGMSSVAGLVDLLNLKVASTTIDNLWQGTQASYDQIPVKDPMTIYFIKIG